MSQDAARNVFRCGLPALQATIDKNTGQSVIIRFEGEIISPGGCVMLYFNHWMHNILCEEPLAGAILDDRPVAGILQIGPTLERPRSLP